MLAIYKKELRSYFNSMIGFIFVAFFLVIIGIYFFIYNLLNAYSNFEYVLQSVSFLFIILVPILTMKVLAEEKRQKTDQLLLTAPISIEKIVVGKYLAVYTLFLTCMVIISLYPIILMQFGTIDLAMAYGSILGFSLLGAAYIAIGVFISALTESQLIASVVSFIVMLLTYLMSGLASVLPTDNRSGWIMLLVLLLVVCIIIYININNSMISVGLALIGATWLTILYFIKPIFYDGLIVNILSWVSVIDRFENFSLGILDISALVYYISVSFIFIFLTISSIKKRRWN
jgi:ABC-2 type transport system permease protein